MSFFQFSTTYFSSIITSFTWIHTKQPTMPRHWVSAIVERGVFCIKQNQLYALKWWTSNGHIPPPRSNYTRNKFEFKIFAVMLNY